jgi:anaphase-promoting complex subunit 4
MVELQELELFSSGTLNAPVANGISSCNPTVDLFATASDANVVNIWRARGQLVAKHVERNHKIEALRWKPDGSFDTARPLRAGYS